MNDSDFEESLRALLPSTPRAAIEAGIAAELSAPGQAITANEPSVGKRQPVSIRFEQAPEPLLVRCFHSLGWAIAGAATAVAAIALYPAKPAPAPEKAAPSTVIAVGFKPTVAAAVTPIPSETLAPEALAPSDLSAPSLPAVSAQATVSGVSDEFEALETTRELISTEEENQVVYRNDNSPMRQVRYVYRERHAWTNPRTGARVEIEVPREDVFLKPVSLQ